MPDGLFDETEAERLLRNLVLPIDEAIWEMASDEMRELILKEKEDAKNSSEEPAGT